jgi:branched-chain amino acid transport system ATP-binding protein
MAHEEAGRMNLLSTTGLTRRYSGLVAVDHVDLDIPEGGIHAVIGPNGAGKTTLFNLVSGLVMPSEGKITFAGTDITNMPSHRRAALGMARTFQNIRIFGAMTVLENVLTGMHPRLHASLGAVIFRLPSFRAEEREAVARARAALDLVGLADRADLPANGLAYGDQRRLEIARAMAPQPRLLLLDEPAAGMNPAETVALADLVRTIAKTGTTVLLVEHDMGFVMGLSDTVAVLNFGRRIFTGTPAGVRADPAVIEAYLGSRLAAKLQAQMEAQHGR